VLYDKACVEKHRSRIIHTNLSHCDMWDIVLVTRMCINIRAGSIRNIREGSIRHLGSCKRMLCALNNMMCMNAFTCIFRCSSMAFANIFKDFVNISKSLYQSTHTYIHTYTHTHTHTHTHVQRYPKSYMHAFFCFCVCVCVCVFV
jgi:hypothetical protein